MRKLILLQTLFFIGIANVFAQKDSIIFNNGNFLVGEVKSLERNVLKVETDYSDADFSVEWDGIREIYTESYFLITLTDGSRYNGTLKSVEPGKISLFTDKFGTIEVKTEQIVLLDDLDKGFWNQIYASIDLGYDFTKASNFKQFSMRSNVGYIAKRWKLDLNFNSLNSKQDNVDDIERNDGGVTYKYFLPHDWYPTVSLDFLSNTDQQLQLRTTSKIGLGKYVVHTNKTYWGFTLGTNYNNENYSEPTVTDRKSLEGFMGTELNFFNVGDLSLLTSLTAYPSFTESGRWRTDFKFDAKYDLPLDFYIKLGYTLNFDNQPATGSPKTDYVFHSGIGWEW